MHLLVHALGGGLGHLQRSLALCRAASRRGHASTILSNSPAWPLIAGNLPTPDVTVRHLAGAEQEVIATASRYFSAGDFDALVVDTFPRGIRGELEDLDVEAPRVFVHRDLVGGYAQRPEVAAAARAFDLMLCPGERGPLEHHRQVTTAPWVLLDADELLGRSAARRHFRATADRPLVVVVDTTDAGEAAGLRAVARMLDRRFGDAGQVRTVTLADSWPLLRLHPGIDLLVGAGGYNTVYEARLTRTPLLAIARHRQYDSQQRRLVPAECFDDMDPPLPSLRPSASVDYENGAHAAVQAIEAVVAAKG